MCYRIGVYGIRSDARFLVEEDERGWLLNGTPTMLFNGTFNQLFQA